MKRANILWVVLAILTFLPCGVIQAQQPDIAAGPLADADVIGPVEEPPAPEPPAIVSGEQKGLDTVFQKLSLKEVDLPQALRLLAEAAGFSLVVGKDVAGKVTCNLSNVTAGVALGTIVRANDCAFSESNGVILVLKAAPAGQGASVAVAVAPPKMVRVILQVPYSGTETDSTVVSASATASAVVSGGGTAKSIEDTIRGMLSPLGRMSYYSRQHLCAVEDTEESVAQIQAFVAELWKIPPQVYIESSLLEVSLLDGETLGFRWNTTSRISGHGTIDQTTGLPGDYRGTMAITSGPALGLDRFFSFGVVNSNISAVLETLATRRHVDLRSNPRVLVMNHRTASIIVGQEIPYLSSIESTSAQPIRTYDFKEVAVRMDVTPHIGENGMIFMDVHPSVKSVIGYTDEPKQPILSTREAATNVSVADGSTLIIGGLVQRNTTRTVNEVPVLGHIPILGWFFRQKAVDDSKNDLIFLINPRIVSEEFMQALIAEKKALITEPAAHPGESPTYLPNW